MQKTKSIVLGLKNDHLYRNSFYVIASTAILAGFGFIFWIFAARLFKPESVGIATTLISVSTLIGSFTQLGLNISLIRYLPKSDKKSDIINSSYIIAILSAIITAAVFVFFIKFFAPELSFLKENPIFYLSFVILMGGLSLNSLLESTYIAYRSSGNILFKNIIISVLKLSFLFVFFTLGAYGIFSSFSVAVFIASIVSLFGLIFKHNYKPALKVSTDIVKKLARFSLANYISGFLYQLPSLLLPLVVLNHLHAKTAAYFYIDTMILNLIIVIPVAASQTLLSEGSHDESLLKHHLLKAMKITTILLVPAIFIVFFFGNYILHFFGKSYEADAFRFLQIISLSAVPIAVSLFGNTILRIYHKMRLLVMLNLISGLVVLTSCYALVSYNLFGLGLGWFIGETISGGIFLIFLIRQLKSYR